MEISPLFVFDFTVSVLGFVANSLVIIAVIRSTLKLSGFRRLLISKSAADLYVCIVNISALVVQIVGLEATHIATDTDILLLEEDAAIITNSTNLDQDNLTLLSLDVESFSICSGRLIHALKMAGFFMNLFNLCGMAMDHVFGIVYPMKYQVLVKKILPQTFVVAIWAASFLLAFADSVAGGFVYIYKKFLEEFGDDPSNSASIPDGRGSLYNAEEISVSLVANYLNDSMINSKEDNSDDRYSGSSLQDLLTILEEEKGFRNAEDCSFLLKSDTLWKELSVIFLSAICFLFLIICYSIVFKKVSRRFYPTLTSQATSSNRHKKLVVTTVLFVAAFTVCWVPFMIYELAMLTFVTDLDSNKQFYYNTMVVVSSVLNSVLMVYPLVDPILYAARIPTVKRSLFQLLSYLSCFPVFGKAKQMIVIRLQTSRTSSSTMPSSLYGVKL